jgi:hypothetical protein
MSRHSSRLASTVAACVLTIAIPAAAQDDPFAQLRTPPPALSNLFEAPADQPAADLSEAVGALAARRVDLGGEPRVHVLLSFDEPLTPELRRELTQQGIQIIDKFDAETWIATVDQGGAAFAESAGPIRGATLIPPQAKLSDAISLEAPFEWQRRDGREELGYSVLFHKGVSAQEAVNSLRTVAEANVERVDAEAFPYVRSLTVDLTSAELAGVARLDVVQSIEPEAPPNIDNNLNNTQPVSNVDDVQGAPYNLSGNGVTVGIWESGDTIRPTHIDLTPRVTVQPGQTSSQDGHALHVAGTVGASGVNFPNAEGMAPQVNILSWDSSSDTTEMANAGGAGTIVASNHSYGAVIGWNGAGTAFTNNQNLFGSYNNRSVAFDTIVAGDGVSVAGTDLVILKSAGNDRNDGANNGVPPGDCRQGGLGVDADCIGPVGSSKNVITVGAMNGGTLIAGFSGFGPTDDGRIKPDVVANGTNVTSLGTVNAAGSDDVPQTDNGTWTTQGTSMSTPAVTGIVALMAEQFTDLGIAPTPSAAAVKAILIQTARDVAGTGQATPGPDFATGWGIADAQAAMDLLRRPGGPGYAEGTLTATGAGGAWEFPFVVPAGEAEMHVTLAWSDLPGTPTGTGSELVNDLDLRLIPPGGGTAQQPWTLNAASPTQAAVRNGGDDAINNVEQVSVLNPASGTWLARVTAKPGSLALGPQQFAIAGPITPDTGPIAGPKANIMMVLDKSGSMILPAATPGMTKMVAMQNAARAFVDYVDLVGGHNVGLVAFDTGVTATSPGFSLQPLDNVSAGDAKTAIGNLSPGGFTGIIAGVTEATNQIAGPNATNPDDVVFLFSDGRHNRPIGSDVSVIDGVMAADTRFFSIGYGTDVDSSVMPGVAGNHDGVHLEEQGLQAGQLAKLFMVVGGLAADETVIIDPDYMVASGATAQQTVLASKADHALTFALVWNEQDSGKFALQLFGPEQKCRVPMEQHQGLNMRRGINYALVRIELPYKCVLGPSTLLHEGPWSLRFSNKGRTQDTVKVTVLSDSGIRLHSDTRVKGNRALLTASLVESDKLLRKGVRVFAHIRPNRPSTGDSEKQDAITDDGRGIAGATDVINVPEVTIERDMGATDNAATEGDMLELDPSISLNPQILTELQERAEILRLSPEIFDQLRGRFLRAPRSTGIELRDDGQNGDAKANDGLFSAVVSLPDPGLYQIRMTASQARPDGTLTREELSSVLMR